MTRKIKIHTTHLLYSIIKINLLQQNSRYELQIIFSCHLATHQFRRRQPVLPFTTASATTMSHGENFVTIHGQKIEK